MATTVPSLEEAGRLPCDCCGAVQWRPVRSPWPVQRCGGCGQVVAKDRFAGTRQDDLYGKEFAAANAHPTYTFDGVTAQIRDERLWQRRFQQLEALTHKGSILDVGCSTGTLLDFARRRGWEPQGIETSSWAVAFARDHFQLQVHDGLLVEGVFANDQFNAIVSSHTLEHVPTPRELLRQFYRVLRPGGVALIVVPTQFASLSYRLSGRPMGVPPPLHVQFYTRATMTRLLRACGFAIAGTAVNLQLAYVAQRLTNSRKVRETMDRQSDQINSLNAGSRGAAPLLVRSIKAVANQMARFADCGDELTVFARKLA